MVHTLAAISRPLMIAATAQALHAQRSNPCLNCGRYDLVSKAAIEIIAHLNVEQADVRIGIYPAVMKLLVDGRWAEAKGWCTHTYKEWQSNGYHSDGIM
jgi:hypothetical protein